MIVMHHPSEPEASASEINRPGRHIRSSPLSQNKKVAPSEPEQPQIAPVIFRAYDIRGVVGETLTEAAVYDIARAIGSMAL